jgi:hypothetical protein
MFFETLLLIAGARAVARILRGTEPEQAEGHEHKQSQNHGHEHAHSHEQLKRDLGVALLGSRTVGKTSMIAAMFNEFERVCASPTLKLIPEEQTGVVLSNLLVDLKKAAEGTSGLFDPLEAGIQRTEEPEEFKVQLACAATHHSASLNLTLHDYPGGWLSETTEGWQEHMGHMQTVVASSQIVLVTFDTPSLMLLQDSAHEEVNHPTGLSNFLKRALLEAPAGDPPDSRRLVVFVPMRGEKWLQDGDAPLLWQHFQERFKAILRVIKGYPDTVGAVYCPVQTLGSVRFDRFEGRRAIFHRTGTGYRPVDCDQPLRYALAFALNTLRRQADDKRQAAATIVANRTGMDHLWFTVLNKGFDVPDRTRVSLSIWEEHVKALLQAVKEFAAGCNKDGPAVVIQNPALFSV